MTGSRDWEWDQWPSHGRFVFLDHRLPPGNPRADHWDLMFETGPDLLTFASAPLERPAGCWPIQPLPRHRLAYLDYEGPISQNRGCVRRIDRGHFVTVDRVVDGITLELNGACFVGLLSLVRQGRSFPGRGLPDSTGVRSAADDRTLPLESWTWQAIWRPVSGAVP